MFKIARNTFAIVAMTALMSTIALPVSAQIAYRVRLIETVAENDTRCLDSAARLFVMRDGPPRISNNVVAGTYTCFEPEWRDPSNFPIAMREPSAFVWRLGLGSHLLWQRASHANGINRHGTIVGAASMWDGPPFGAVVWSQGEMEALTELSSGTCDDGKGRAVNRWETVLYETRTRIGGDCRHRVAVRLASGEIIESGNQTTGIAVNDAGVVLGSRLFSSPFFWIPATNAWTDFGISADRPMDISNSNAVVGYSRASGVVGCNNVHVAFFYAFGTNRTRHILPAGIAGARINMAYGINDRGQIVGTSTTDYSCAPSNLFPLDGGRAILWNPPSTPGGAHVPLSLNQVIDRSLDLVLTEALDITEHGVILASGYYRNAPLLPCPMNERHVGPNGEESFAANPHRMCRQQRLFQLTPT